LKLKYPDLISDAETRDNICKKKGKKKNFFLLTFTIILYGYEHQVFILRNKYQKK